MLTTGNLQQKLAEMRSLRDHLDDKIRRVSAILKMREQRERRRKALADKILPLIESHGGRENFIERYGGGQKIVHGFRKYGDEQCSETWGPFVWHADECRYLGTRPATHEGHCDFRGRYVYDGKRYCRIHLKMRLEHRDSPYHDVTSQLLDQFKVQETA
jgi:hypothetical protein